MRCRRCQSTIVESHVDKTDASAQTWVRCSLCGSTSIFTTPASASANDRSGQSLIDNVETPDASADSAFDLTPTSSSALRF